MAKKQDTTDRDKKIKEANGTFGELKLMVTDYTKQQTVEPLKHLASWAIFGIVGAVFMSIGAFLLSLGTLRLFQKWDWTEGNGSFAPYLLVFVLLLVCAGMCFWAMTRTPEWMDD